MLRERECACQVGGVGGPSTPNGQTASGRPKRVAAGAAGATWGSPVREREEPAPTSSAKRRRVQTALFRDDDDATARQAVPYCVQFAKQSRYCDVRKRKCAATQLSIGVHAPEQLSFPVSCRLPTRRSERRNDADQAVGVDALLSLASVGRDDSGPADGKCRPRSWSATHLHYLT